MIKQIVYTSRIASEINNSDIEQIIEGSREYNRSADITGLLAFNKQHFLQVIEGPEDKIDMLYAKIASDKRHSDVQKVYEATADKRLFEEWSMAYLEGGKANVWDEDLVVSSKLFLDFALSDNILSNETEQIFSDLYEQL